MDSALIRRCLAGWSVTIDEKAADVNGDGEISLMDSALIRRHLAGWNVTLGEK
jgi:endoglucanase